MFYAFSSSKNLVTKTKQHNWVKTLDTQDPILECQQHGKHYKIYLTLDSSNRTTETIEGTEIGLKVVDAQHNNKITWGVGSKEEERWNEWKLRLSSNEGINLWVPSDDKHLTSTGYFSIKCESYKLKSALGRGNGLEQTVSVNSITFSATLKNSHEVPLVRKEYDINIVAGNNLVWGEGFRPKAIAESK